MCVVFISAIVNDQLGVIKLREQQCQSLENEVNILTNAIEEHKKNFNNLKRERDRNVSNSQAKNDKMDATQSELATKMKEIIDLSWELNQTRIKLTHSQQQLETVTTEQITLQKSLDAITDDRNDVREKLRVSFLFSNKIVLYVQRIHIERRKKQKTISQIAIAEQNKLKQTIAAKNTENARAQKQIDKIEKERNTLKIELQNANVSLQHIRSELAEKEHEFRCLYRSLTDEEEKRSKMEKKFEGMQNEKDRLSAELVKTIEANEVWKEKRELMIVALDRGTESRSNDLQ